MPHIGGHLSSIRTARTLSQSEAGKACGITRTSVCHYERGTKALSLRMLCRMLDGYDADTSERLIARMLFTEAAASKGAA